MKRAKGNYKKKNMKKYFKDERNDREKSSVP